MSASAIFFNGKLIRVPGSYSEVDASGLEFIGLGATGVVAVVGEADDGEPGVVKEIAFPDKARQIFASGDLVEAIGQIFTPARDADVPAGAQKVFAVRVGAATQATRTLTNANGNALVLTSEKWGLRGNQTKVTVATGTLKGKALTLALEATEETVDDLGGDTIFTLAFASGATYGTTTATAARPTTGDRLNLALSHAAVGRDDVVTQPVAGGVVSIARSNVLDNGRTVTVYGLSATNVPISEAIPIAAATNVGAVSFTIVTAFKADGTAALNGTLTLTIGAPPDVGTLTGTTLTRGLCAFTAFQHLYSNGQFRVVANGATTRDLVIRGTNAADQAVAERIVLNGAVAVNTVSTTLRSISQIELGRVESVRTITLDQVTVIPTVLFSSYGTVQKLSDYFSAFSGFTVTIVVTNPTAFNPANLDYVPSATSITGAGLNFAADLYTMVTWINDNSQLATAVRSALGYAAPANTGGALFLTGATQPNPVLANWTAAFTALRKKRINQLVTLYDAYATRAIGTEVDTGLALALEADEHCAYMGGIGRAECDYVAGVPFEGTLANIKTFIRSINSRHTAVVAQRFERFNAAGVRTTFGPNFLAGLAQGTEAGMPVGTPGTHKLLNALAISEHSSWDSQADQEEMLAAGLMFAETIDGLGVRWVRSITSYLTDSNLARTEKSVNHAANIAVYEFRTRMERMVGRAGFAGTANAAKSLAIGVLGQLLDEGIITAHRSLSVRLLGDTLEVEVEIAPTVGINFVKNTIHLVAAPQAA